MPANIAAALREIGQKIDGPRTAALYTPLQSTEPYAGEAVVRDLHYGPHERHVLDVFTTNAADGSAAARPLVVFIHGGGFTRGAKHAPGSPFYDNIGVWAVRFGLVGVFFFFCFVLVFLWSVGIEDLTLQTK